MYWIVEAILSSLGVTAETDKSRSSEPGLESTLLVKCSRISLLKKNNKSSSA